jgi:zinc transport system substrate-binding protein
LVIALFFLGAFLWTGSKESPVPEESQKIKVATSFYPLYFFAKSVGGDKVDVFNITPAGAEPHDYELTTADRIKIQKSRLLVLNGGVEPWGDKISQTLNANNVKVVIAGESILTRQINEGESSVVDPHVWLDPILAKVEVAKITDGLVAVDGKDSGYFRDMQNQLDAKLDGLDKSYREGLAACQLKDIVTSHAAFGYLAARYNLGQVAIAGLSPDEEPSSQKLAEVANFAAKNKIEYIFFESLVSPKLSVTIASEVGAKTMVLNPLEGLSGEDTRAGRDYFSVAKDNLNNIKIALKCQ